MTVSPYLMFPLRTEAEAREDIAAGHDAIGAFLSALDHSVTDGKVEPKADNDER